MYTIGYSLEELISSIPEQQIYSYYIGPIKVGIPTHSPLRSKDDNPSFCIFYSRRNGKLMYKDFGTSESGDCVQFVRNLLNLKTTHDAKLRILSDFYSGSLSTVKSVEYVCTTKQERTKFSIEEQPFTDIDLNYWSKYSIKKSTLDYFNIVSVKRLYIKDKLYWVYSLENPIYGYKINDALKCYRPYGGKGNKFRTNCSVYDIQGYSQLPDKGDLLIITKALKDVAVLYELGYTAIAPGSEGASIPVEIMLDLKSRFTQLICFYDNDEAGIIAAKKLNTLYQIKTVAIDKEYESKDVSDLLQKTTKEETNAYVSKLFKL